MPIKPVIHPMLRRLRGIAIALTLSACATLPDIGNLKAALPTDATPTIVNGQQALPAARAESILARRVRSAKVDINTLASIEQAATGFPLVAGNKVTLLFDGPQAINAMMAAIKNAQHHINLETYIFDQDELGLRFAELLIAKQRAGVQVNILYDSVGTIGTPKEFFTSMRDAGINLIEFNPVNPLKAPAGWRVNNRDHRKVLVVDGRIGFTGGVNITRDYTKSSLFRLKKKQHAGELGWRDTHVQIEGPAVASLQVFFLQGWASQKKEELPDLDLFPNLKPIGDKLVRVIASQPDGDFEIYKSYAIAVQQAKKSIHITAAYFAPDVQLIAALKQAAKRGVDVQMIFPSISDAGLVFQASHSFYSELLEAGVKIHQLKASVLHAKTAVIDGVWSTVGSANLDIRSFVHNSEINIVVLGEEFGGQMENAFQEDIRNSIPVTIESWAQRPFTDRIKEWLASRFDYWL